MKRRHGREPLSDDEQIARYAYLLGNVPRSVADKAYAAAFAKLSPEQRHAIVDGLCARLPVAAQRPATDDAEGFAVLMRNLHARLALVEIPGAAALALEFVASPPIVAYFTTGAGSVTMDHQPLWVQEVAGHESAPIDGGRMHHRRGASLGDWRRSRSE